MNLENQRANAAPSGIFDEFGFVLPKMKIYAIFYCIFKDNTRLWCSLVSLSKRSAEDAELLTELAEIASAEEAGSWAQRILGVKNSLTAADARQVEDAFRAKMATLESAADVDDVLSSPVISAVQPSSSLERQAGEPASITDGIDKSRLAHPEPRRFRDKNHVKFVAKQPCLICGRRPSDAHHLRFAQHRALGRKVSDEFIVPLCRGHHREVHRSGDEASWWSKAGIDPIGIARKLWTETHPVFPPANDISADVVMPKTAARKELDNSTRVPRIPKREPL